MDEKLNTATVPASFQLLDNMERREMYDFLDGLTVTINSNGSGQQERTTFMTKWDVSVTTVMMFRLQNAPATFQRTVQEIFNYYRTVFHKRFCR